MFSPDSRTVRYILPHLLYRSVSVSLCLPPLPPPYIWFCFCFPEIILRVSWRYHDLLPLNIQCFLRTRTFLFITTVWLSNSENLTSQYYYLIYNWYLITWVNNVLYIFCPFLSILLTPPPSSLGPSTGSHNAAMHSVVCFFNLFILEQFLGLFLLLLSFVFLDFDIFEENKTVIL